MPYFVLGVAILVGVALAARWYISAAPQSILRVFKWTAMIGCIAGMGAYITTGQVIPGIF